MANRREQIGNILRDLKEGFTTDVQIGREDRQKAYYQEREALGKQAEGPRIDSLMGTHQGMTRVKEALNMLTPEKKRALQDHDINLRGSTAHKVGQFVGSAANDIVTDGTRAIYWLINAPQATADIVQEKVVNATEPGLYGKTGVQSKNVPYMIDDSGKKVPRMLTRGSSLDVDEMKKMGAVREVDGKVEARRGYSFDKDGKLQKRNYSPGALAALSIPTGIAINNAIGLLNPMGGAEGYKAAIPSDEDPTKTDNAVLEVALKYFMGRSGQLLPYDEFSKVRPDVSPEEYGQYQAYKYNKQEDWNPLDGDLNILQGFIRANADGIHGPEAQMMGRSIPLTTGILPAAAAIAGTAAGARIGHRRGVGGRGAIGGLAGGTIGLTAGSVLGNIIEGERRRRNELENTKDGSL